MDVLPRALEMSPTLIDGCFCKSVFANVYPGIHDFEDLGEGLFRDHYGITWDRSIDKDIGVPVEPLLKEPQLIRDARAEYVGNQALRTAQQSVNDTFAQTESRARDARDACR